MSGYCSCNLYYRVIFLTFTNPHNDVVFGDNDKQNAIGISYINKQFRIQCTKNDSIYNTCPRTEASSLNFNLHES